MPPLPGQDPMLIDNPKDGPAIRWQWRASQAFGGAYLAGFRTKEDAEAYGRIVGYC